MLLYTSTEEEFAFVVLFFFNVLFAFITQFGRWMLGSFENYQFELLSGTFSTKSNQIQIFWPLFLSIVFSILLTGCISLSIKKYRTNKNMVQAINIQLEDLEIPRSMFLQLNVSEFQNIETQVLVYLLTNLLYTSQTCQPQFRLFKTLSNFRTLEIKKKYQILLILGHVYCEFCT